MSGRIEIPDYLKGLFKGLPKRVQSKLIEDYQANEAEMARLRELSKQRNAEEVNRIVVTSFIMGVTSNFPDEMQELGVNGIMELVKKK